MTIRRRGGLIEEDLTHAVIGGFFAVHRKLGFGFLEQIYASALELELTARGHRVGREVEVIIRYDGVPIGRQRLDMIVDDKVIVEIKSSERLHKDAGRQVYTYLRATSLEVGLLLHFGREANFYRLVFENARKHA
jgi:GxxExxY protein